MSGAERETMSLEQKTDSAPAAEEIDRDLLLSVVEAIVPAREVGGAMPAASELEEFRSLPPEEARFLYGPILGLVQGGDRSRGREQFVSLDRQSRESILRELEEDHPAVVKGAVFQTLIRYYGSNRVAEGLGLEARPPHPGGYSLGETNWALLDPVREMEPIYKRAPGPGEKS